MSGSYDQAWFYGPLAAVVAGRTQLAADPKVVGMEPAIGQPPTMLDVDGTDAAFIAVFRTGEPPAVPVGLKQARATVGSVALGTA